MVNESPNNKEILAAQKLLTEKKCVLGPASATSLAGAMREIRQARSRRQQSGQYPHRARFERPLHRYQAEYGAVAHHRGATGRGEEGDSGQYVACCRRGVDALCYLRTIILLFL